MAPTRQMWLILFALIGAVCADGQSCKCATATTSDGIGFCSYGFDLSLRFFPMEASADRAVLTWHQADSECQCWGGRLAKIRSPDMNGVVRLLASARPVWIGAATDSTQEGKWVWADGSALSYSSWDAQQSDDVAGQAGQCAAMGHWQHNDNDGYWRAMSCGGTLRNGSSSVSGYICEKYEPMQYISHKGGCVAAEDGSSIHSEHQKGDPWQEAECRGLCTSNASCIAYEITDGNMCLLHAATTTSQAWTSVSGNGQNVGQCFVKTSPMCKDGGAQGGAERGGGMPSCAHERQSQGARSASATGGGSTLVGADAVVSARLLSTGNHRRRSGSTTTGDTTRRRRSKSGAVERLTLSASIAVTAFHLAAPLGA